MLGLQFSVLWLIEQVLIKRQMASYRILTKTQKILKQNKEKSMLDRRKFLKIGASLSALPLIPSLSAGKTVEASKVSLGLVKMEK